MKQYFQLQFTRLHRHLRANGLPAWAGYALIPVAFVPLTLYLFALTEFASYIYAMVAFSVLAPLSGAQRNDFLKSIFSQRAYRQVRVLENLLYCSPFLLSPLALGAPLLAAALAAMAVGMALVSHRASGSITLPTPFGKRPFEFTVGFRNTFAAFPLAYFLAFMGIWTGNFQLGAFALLLLAVVCSTYYTKPENEYIVWNFNASPRRFLLQKIGTGLWYFTLLCVPVLATLPFFFPAKALVLLALMPLCYLFLVIVLLAKYAAFPYEISVPQGILIALCFAFPPTVLGVVPYFFSQSVKKLQPLLHDSH